jgi:hypothetical protein
MRGVIAMKVCISIAVSRPEGQLAPLPGAIEASRDFVKWANAAKFDKVLAVTDEAGWPVTVAGLRAAFKDAIGNSANVVDHLVVHFAGHGFTDDIDDQLLLLTNWQRETTEAINVRRFVRLLEYYQPTRVSLFFDACRSEKPKDADQLQGSGVLERPKHKTAFVLRQHVPSRTCCLVTMANHHDAYFLRCCLRHSVVAFQRHSRTVAPERQSRQMDSIAR